MTRASDPPGVPPGWLADFQARFSSVLRMPLARDTGTLADRRTAYSAAACADGRADAVRERFAVYNRQYWFRLLSALQHELPLVHRLLGSWTFNAYVLRFLEAEPPRAADLAEAADGLASFLAANAPEPSVELPRGRSLPRRALLQAAQIDDAFRAVLRARAQGSFAINALDATALLEARLIRSEALRLIEEDWPLVKLRSAARAPSDERAESLPEAHPRTQRWALCANSEGFRALPLEPLHAELLELLDEHTVAGALGRLEHAHPEATDLPERVGAWLSEDVRSSFWTAWTR